MINIFIDESGTLPDVRDNFIVICGVAVNDKKEAENIFSRILKSLKAKKINIKEIKFYHAGQNTKRQFLSGISAADFKIFALIIDKKKRKIADSPENYGILLKNLIIDIISWNKKESLLFILDRHFQKSLDEKELNDFIGKGIFDAFGKVDFKIKHVDSKQDFLVNVADMAAGAILWKFRGKDKQFYDLIKENIIVEKVVNWPEIKRSEKTKKIT